MAVAEGWPALDFLVIGAYKSGTTALQGILEQHPQIYVPRKKEPNFFAFEGGIDADHPVAVNAVTDLGDYRRLFDSVAAETAVGEVSPEYLVSERACQRIHEVYPDVRLVAILRNPIERAYSDYLMYRRDGLEPLDDFSRALDEQDERARRRLPTGYYIRTGFYGTQLERYVDRFDADAIHVILYEDFRDDPDGVLTRLFAFLGVDDAFHPDLRRHRNVSGVPRHRAVRWALRVRSALRPRLASRVPEVAKRFFERAVSRGLDRPPLPDAARERLEEVYGSDIAHLERLIGRDLGHWVGKDRIVPPR